MSEPKIIGLLGAVRAKDGGIAVNVVLTYLNSRPIAQGRLTRKQALHLAGELVRLVEIGLPE